VNNWVAKSRVNLNDAWGQSFKELLYNPLGKLAEFAVRARHLRDTSANLQLSHFTIDFQSGYLAEGWAGSSFTPMGKNPVKTITGLPPWSSGASATYRKVIDAAGTELGNSATARLQGVVSYLNAQGQVIYDTVKLFYVTNAVNDSKNPDLVVVTTQSLSGSAGGVQGRQDGTGQGPPH
jgi:hypothetical protein